MPSEETSIPLPYEEWGEKPLARHYAAAYIFGFDLMRRCREQALIAVKNMPPGSDPMQIAEQAIDTELFNVVDLLDGFWPMDAGPNHRAEYILTLCVNGADGQPIEKIEINTAGLDLAMGYWRWRDGIFR